MKKVVAIDRAFPSYDTLKEKLELLDAQLVFAEDKSEKSLAALCADADAVMVTFTQVTEQILKEMKPGSMVVRTGIGVDNIDVNAAKKYGVQVSFVPDYCREEVADHTLALILNTIRKVTLSGRIAQEDWDVKKKIGFVPRLQTCVAGLLGFGAISRMIAVRLQAFGVSVCAFDPYLPDSVFTQMNVSRCPSQDEIFEKADLIILTGPLTPERHHIINRDSLNRMKKTAFVFNTARGAMVDEKALCEAIGSGRIAGAGLDVFEQEPIRNAELYKMDQLVVTPHIAFYSEQSLPDMQNKVFDEVIRAVKGEPLRIHV